MNLLSFWSRIFPRLGRPDRPEKRQKPTARPTLLHLEERLTPAVALFTTVSGQPTLTITLAANEAFDYFNEYKNLTGTPVATSGFFKLSKYNSTSQGYDPVPWGTVTDTSRTWVKTKVGLDGISNDSLQLAAGKSISGIAIKVVGGSSYDAAYFRANPNLPDGQFNAPLEVASSVDDTVVQDHPLKNSEDIRLLSPSVTAYADILGGKNVTLTSAIGSSPVMYVDGSRLIKAGGPGGSGGYALTISSTIEGTNASGNNAAIIANPGGPVTLGSGAGGNLPTTVLSGLTVTGTSITTRGSFYYAADYMRFMGPVTLDSSTTTLFSVDNELLLDRGITSSATARSVIFDCNGGSTVTIHALTGGTPSVFSSAEFRPLAGSDGAKVYLGGDIQTTSSTGTIKVNTPLYLTGNSSFKTTGSGTVQVGATGSIQSADSGKPAALSIESSQLQLTGGLGSENPLASLAITGGMKTLATTSITTVGNTSQSGSTSNIQITGRLTVISQKGDISIPNRFLSADTAKTGALTLKAAGKLALSQSTTAMELVAFNLAGSSIDLVPSLTASGPDGIVMDGALTLRGNGTYSVTNPNAPIRLGAVEGDISGRNLALASAGGAVVLGGAVGQAKSLGTLAVTGAGSFTLAAALRASTSVSIQANTLDIGALLETDTATLVNTSSANSLTIGASNSSQANNLIANLVTVGTADTSISINGPFPGGADRLRFLGPVVLDSLTPTLFRAGTELLFNQGITSGSTARSVIFEMTSGSTNTIHALTSGAPSVFSSAEFRQVAGAVGSRIVVGGNFQTSGSLQVNTPLYLSADTTLKASGSVQVGVDGSIQSADPTKPAGLSIESSLLQLTGKLGSENPLASLTITGGLKTLAATSITTVGTISQAGSADSIPLTGKLTAISQKGDISIPNRFLSADTAKTGAITLKAAGKLALSQSTTAMELVAFNLAGSSIDLVPSLTASGPDGIVMDGALTLRGNGTYSVTNPNAPIRLGAVEGDISGRNLALASAGGAVVLGGAVGQAKSLGTLAVTGAGSFALTAALRATTSASIQADALDIGALLETGTATLSNTSATKGMTLDASSSSQADYLKATLITVGSADSTITVNGPFPYNADHLRFMGPVIINSLTPTLFRAGTELLFNQGITSGSTARSVIFEMNSGSTNTIHALTSGAPSVFSSAEFRQVAGAVGSRIVVGGNFQTSGSLQVNTPLYLSADTTLKASGSVQVGVDGSIQSADPTKPAGLSIESSLLQLTGKLGSENPLASLTITGGLKTLAATSITTVGTISQAGSADNIPLTGKLTAISQKGDISIPNRFLSADTAKTGALTLKAAGKLALSQSTTAMELVAFNLAGSSIDLVPSLTASGPDGIVMDGALTLRGNGTYSVTNPNAPIRLGAVEGDISGRNLALASAGGAVVLGGAVGQAKSLGTLAVTGAGSFALTAALRATTSASIQADALDIGALLETGTATLVNTTPGKTLVLGASTGGDLALDRSELSNLHATTLNLGSTQTSNTTGLITLAGDAPFSGVTTLHLIAPAGIATSHSSGLTVPTLVINSEKSIDLSGNNTVCTVAGTVLGDLAFTTTGSVQLGTRDTRLSVTGNATISANGSITQGTDIVFAGRLDLSANGIGTNHDILLANPDNHLGQVSLGAAGAVDLASSIDLALSQLVPLAGALSARVESLSATSGATSKLILAGNLDISGPIHLTSKGAPLSLAGGTGIRSHAVSGNGILIVGGISNAAGTSLTLDSGGGSLVVDLLTLTGGPSNLTIPSLAGDSTIDRLTAGTVTVQNGTGTLNLHAPTTQSLTIAGGSLNLVCTSIAGVDALTANNTGLTTLGSIGNTLTLPAGAIVNRLVTGPGVSGVSIPDGGTLRGSFTVASGMTLTVGDSPSDTLTTEAGITVATGGILNGTGTIQGGLAIQSGGIYAPGKQIVTGNLALEAGSRLQVDLRQANYGPGKGPLKVLGNAAINGSILELTNTSNYQATPGSTFTVLESGSAGGTSGKFAGIPEGTLITNSSGKFSVGYTGGTSKQDTTLTFEQQKPSSTPIIKVGASRVILSRVAIYLHQTISSLPGLFKR